MTTVERPAGGARYVAAVRFLEDLAAGRHHGGRGLTRAGRLLAALGDPQDAVPAVHVAGTAGKGSVCAVITAMLLAHGFRVGTFLSPHAYDLRERFLVDGVPIAPGLLADAVADVRAAAAAATAPEIGRPSFFEAATATAFRLFAGPGGHLGYVVVETGIGGRLDATNTIGRADKLAVLTTIGLDHAEILGPTPAHIADQKAGILPAGGVAVTDRQMPEAARVVAAEAARRGCRLHTVTPSARDDGSWPEHRRRNHAVAAPRPRRSSSSAPSGSSARRRPRSPALQLHGRPDDPHQQPSAPRPHPAP